MRKRTHAGETVTATVLAYISGFVDTLSFIALFGLFASHVTGNFVLIATSIAEEHRGLWIKLLAVPVFIIAAILTRLYIIRRHHHQRDAATHVLMGQAVLLSIFMIIAKMNSPLVDHNSAAAIATGLIAAAAMAIQNTAARTFLSHLPPTTVMTGNMMQIIVDAVDIMHGQGDVSAQRKRIARLVPLMIGFILGTLSGGAGYIFFGFTALIVPAVSVAVLALLVHPSHHPVQT